MGHLSGASGSEIEHCCWGVKHLIKQQNILHVAEGLILRQSLILKQLEG